jgi:hypothetical protein
MLIQALKNVATHTKLFLYTGLIYPALPDYVQAECARIWYHPMEDSDRLHLVNLLGDYFCWECKRPLYLCVCDEFGYGQVEQ